MPRTPPIVRHPPEAVADTLSRLGRNIRTARLRRRLTQLQVARRAGVSRFVVADLERGKPGTGIAAYLGALWVLGLLDHMDDVADPERDREGALLERSRGPQRARPRQALDDDF